MKRGERNDTPGRETESERKTIDAKHGSREIAFLLKTSKILLACLIEREAFVEFLVAVKGCPVWLQICPRLTPRKYKS